ncbi:UDP-N-acetylglucosamine-peptide N-acetylglucosaminyltransferase [Massilia genomosp. 1]|uniref:UDP-N-acetylglucosamine-peptide N-acetylglucosaminyltransferase n=1 Tax=Massilia genomosp. 1 TaxID=2609280 RepID=A0ABX0MTC7_9BURK|nr:UDP-N-acetylglucosamine-peptide N-acetylglucosaminyltransferase [Massilia genomosp. 1]NHZ65993.1 UDP-N-acetylglucosamine-peptide N-acetylglucosaminyltransferase [Massilia genomosp. 1]
MDAAQALLEHARASHPHDPQVLTCLGAVLCDRALYHEAEAVLRAALAQGSPDRHTTFNLAVAVFNTGTRRQALALFGAAARMQPCAITWAAYFDPHGT